MVILAFEAINNCRLSIRIGRVDLGRESVLAFNAEAWPTDQESGEAKPLGSVQWVTGSTERRTMDALILQLLYRLDAELAVGEFKRAIKDT